MAEVSHEGGSTSLPDPSEFLLPAYIELRKQALIRQAELAGFTGIDEGHPTLPAGHEYAIRKSTWLTSEFRRQHRKGAMDITPQDVVDALAAGGVKNWVLMGLHGYVGYLPDPRATQDVDVMVPHTERKRAAKAIAARWPELQVREIPQVTRFLDPNDLDRAGNPKAVIDIMHPWSPFQELILEEYVVVDERTQHRLPKVEAAIVSKYASMLSPHRDRDKKEQDAVDFRRIVRANSERLGGDDLHRLAALVWEGGAADIDRFVKIALSDEPFPI